MPYVLKKSLTFSENYVIIRVRIYSQFATLLYIYRVDRFLQAILIQPPAILRNPKPFKIRYMMQSFTPFTFPQFAFLFTACLSSATAPALSALSFLLLIIYKIGSFCSSRKLPSLSPKRRFYIYHIVAVCAYVFIVRLQAMHFLSFAAFCCCCLCRSCDYSIT